MGKKKIENIDDNLFADDEASKKRLERMLETNIALQLKDAELKALIGLIQFKGKSYMEGETDEPVTADMKRLIRMVTSLHGKSSLRVTPLTRDQLDDFLPLRDAIAFGDDPIKVELNAPQRVKIGDEELKLKPGIAEVPLCMAMHMFCKRMAVLPANDH